MRIYIAHSREIDYVNNLYKPLRNDPFFNEYDLILPHETDKPNNTRDLYSMQFFGNLYIFFSAICDIIFVFTAIYLRPQWHVPNGILAFYNSRSPVS